MLQSFYISSDNKLFVSQSYGQSFKMLDLPVLSSNGWFFCNIKGSSGFSSIHDIDIMWTHPAPKTEGICIYVRVANSYYFGKTRTSYSMSISSMEDSSEDVWFHNMKNLQVNGWTTRGVILDRIDNVIRRFRVEPKDNALLYLGQRYPAEHENGTIGKLRLLCGTVEGFEDNNVKVFWRVLDDQNQTVMMFLKITNKKGQHSWYFQSGKLDVVFEVKSFEKSFEHAKRNWIDRGKPKKDDEHFLLTPTNRLILPWIDRSSSFSACGQNNTVGYHCYGNGDVWWKVFNDKSAIVFFRRVGNDTPLLSLAKPCRDLKFPLSEFVDANQSNCAEVFRVDIASFLPNYALKNVPKFVQTKDEQTKDKQTTEKKRSFCDQVIVRILEEVKKHLNLLSSDDVATLSKSESQLMSLVKHALTLSNTKPTRDDFYDKVASLLFVEVEKCFDTLSAPNNRLVSLMRVGKVLDNTYEQLQ